jgi:hypothetical protein
LDWQSLSRERINSWTSWKKGGGPEVRKIVGRGKSSISEEINWGIKCIKRIRRTTQEIARRINSSIIIKRFIKRVIGEGQKA